MSFSINAAKATIMQPLLAYNFILNGIPNVNPLNVRGANIPGKKFDEINLKLRGRDLYYAGNIGRFDSMSITVFEDVSYTARTMLELWTQVIGDNATGFGFATPVISKDLTLYLLAPGTEQIVAAYTLINAWPTSISGVTLSYDDVTSPVNYTVEFRYDYWKRADISGFSAITDLTSKLGF